MTHVRLNLTGPNDQSIHLDGEDISNSVARVDVQCAAGQLPKVTISLGLASHITAEGETEVFMSTATSNLLRRAGWTPPEGSRLGAEPITLAPADESPGSRE